MPDSTSLDFHPKEITERVPFNKKTSSAQSIFKVRRHKEMVLEEVQNLKEQRDPEKEKKQENIRKLKKQLG